jgi:hypothetical protein
MPGSRFQSHQSSEETVHTTPQMVNDQWQNGDLNYTRIRPRTTTVAIAWGKH